jgi:hypothetical protein
MVAPRGRYPVGRRRTAGAQGRHYSAVASTTEGLNHPRPRRKSRNGAKFLGFFKMVTASEAIAGCRSSRPQTEHLANKRLSVWPRGNTSRKPYGSTAARDLNSTKVAARKQRLTPLRGGHWHPGQVQVHIVPGRNQA